MGVASPSTHVRVGEHDISTTNDGAIAEDIPIAKSKTHEKYSASDLQNDIAIVSLQRPVTFRLGVSPACLPNQVIMQHCLFITCGTQVLTHSFGPPYPLKLACDEIAQMVRWLLIQGTQVRVQSSA